MGRGFTLSGNYAYQVGTVTLRDSRGPYSMIMLETPLLNVK